MVTQRVLRSLLDADAILPALVVGDVAAPRATVRPEDTLGTVVETLAAADCDEVLVLGENGEVVGAVGYEDIARFGFREAARAGGTDRRGSPDGGEGAA
jgi:CBS domain-containing protein